MKQIDFALLYKLSTRTFRVARMRHFYQLYRVSPTTTVLDVGGTSLNWSLCSFRPRLTILNLVEPDKQTDLSWIIGNGCHLPFRDKSFDIVYSNSVIEHLGTWENQQTFAREVRRVGVSFFIQTPSKYFPVEPHLLTPLVHYLPKSLQRGLLRNFTVWGLITRPTEEQCERLHREIRLLNAAELKLLFPEARIFCERWFGLTKSYYCEFVNH